MPRGIGYFHIGARFLPGEDGGMYRGLARYLEAEAKVLDRIDEIPEDLAAELHAMFTICHDRIQRLLDDGADPHSLPVAGRSVPGAPPRLEAA